MRFVRQAAIFRGPIDPAALVCVLFLLVLFMAVSSLLYTPGVQIGFEDPFPPGAPILTVTSDSDIVFAGKTNKVTELAQLRASIKQTPNNLPIRLQVESGADPKVVEQVQEMFQVHLPTNTVGDLTGTDNPHVIVWVNFRGQCFFENRPITDAELETELRSRLQEAAAASQKLTMVLAADAATENEAIMRVYRLAHRAGITNFIQGEALPPPRPRQ